MKLINVFDNDDHRSFIILYHDNGFFILSLPLEKAIYDNINKDTGLHARIVYNLDVVQRFLLSSDRRLFRSREELIHYLYLTKSVYCYEPVSLQNNIPPSLVVFLLQHWHFQGSFMHLPACIELEPLPDL
jgi:hypothetical protein